MNHDELKKEVADYVEARLTHYDCLKWHTGKGMSRNVAKLLKYVRENMNDPEAYMNIWGMPEPKDGEMDLSVEIY